MIATKKIFQLSVLLSFLLSACSSEDDSATTNTVNLDPLVNLLEKPEVITYPALKIRINSAEVSGEVQSDKGYTIIQKGIVWGVEIDPTIENDNFSNEGLVDGVFNSVLNDLSPETRYYYRAYAVNSKNLVGYGNTKLFETLGELFDVNGNSYGTIEIGQQTWMSEDLKSISFNDGTSIQQVNNNSSWFDETVLNQNPALRPNPVTGISLYNHHVISSSKNVCPSGWRIPTSDDWTELVLNTGGFEGAGNALRSENNWQNSALITNSSNFTSVPTGSCLFDGIIQNNDRALYWSSSTIPGDTYPIYYIINDNITGSIETDSDDALGLAIRCIKE